LQKNSEIITYFVCNRSKESARGKVGHRLERPVRKNYSTKLNFNCLASITAVENQDGSVDVEFLNFHTCCVNGQDSFQKPLKAAVKFDIEAQIEQGLSVERILKKHESAVQ
jgi:hypothetical protein